MAVKQPPAYLAGTYTAAHLRAYAGLPFLQDPAATVPAPLSGVIPRGGNLDFSLSQNGSTVTVGVGAAVIGGSENVQQYGYLIINESAISYAIPAAPTSQTRLDRIVARVRDSAYSGANADADIVLVQGTPASSNPQLPAAPADSLTLATVSTTGTGTPTVTPTWAYTAGVAGIRPARGGTVDDGLAPAFAGQYRDLGGRLQRGSGPAGTWQVLADANAWTAFTPTLYCDHNTPGAAFTIPMGATGSAVGRYLVQGKTMHLRYTFRASGAGYDGGYGYISTRLPGGFLSSTVEEQQIVGKLVTRNGANAVTGQWAGPAFLQANSQVLAPYFSNALADSSLNQYRIANAQGAAGTGTPTIPSGFPDLMVLTIQGTIEIQ